MSNKMMEYDRDETERVDEEGAVDWEAGLPSHHDLTPLSQCLIPPELALAFGITPEPCRNIFDVNRASRDTLASLRSQSSQPLSSSSNNFDHMPLENGIREGNCKMDMELEDLAREDGSETRKLRRRIIESCAKEEEDEEEEEEEEDSSSLHADNACDDMSGKALKRPRLVWTPQLHKRFVDVVAHLGIKNAVPKTIMQLMNVEGLTRENVASHLQKYRLYLKRMQGLSNEGPSSSDHLFASTPVPQSLHESSEQSKGHTNRSNATMPCPPPQLMSMPMIGLGHIGMPPIVPTPNYHGIESYHYNMIPHKDWSLARFASSHHISSNEK